MAHKDRKAVKEAAEAARVALQAAKPGAHLGDLLWWDFAAGWRGDATAVRAEHNAIGLNADADWPGVPGYEVAFGRAVDACRVAMAGANLRPETAEAGPNSEKRVAILSLTRGADVDGRTVGIVSLPKGASPTIERADPSGWAGRIVQRSAEYVGRYTTDDARAMVVSLLDRWACTPCRSTPPHIVYWAPAGAGETIRKIKTVLGTVGAGTILISPQHDGAEEREAATYAANAGLESKLTEFATTVDEWRNNAPARVSTVQAKLEELDRLRQTGNLYRGILGDAVKGIDARIADVERAMRVTLGIVEAKRAA